MDMTWVSWVVIGLISLWAGWHAWGLGARYLSRKREWDKEREQFVKSAERTLEKIMEAGQQPALHLTTSMSVLFREAMLANSRVEYLDTQAYQKLLLAAGFAARALLQEQIKTILQPGQPSQTLLECAISNLLFLEETYQTDSSDRDTLTMLCAYRALRRNRPSGDSTTS